MPESRLAFLAVSTQFITLCRISGLYFLVFLSKLTSLCWMLETNFYRGYFLAFLSTNLFFLKSYLLNIFMLDIQTTFSCLSIENNLFMLEIQTIFQTCLSHQTNHFLLEIQTIFPCISHQTNLLMLEILHAFLAFPTNLTSLCWKSRLYFLAFPTKLTSLCWKF